MDHWPRIQIIAECPCCPHIFETQKKLRFHIKNEHGCSYPIVRVERLHATACLLCTAILKNKQELSRHLTSAHRTGQVIREGHFKVVLKRLEKKFFKNQRIIFC